MMPKYVPVFPGDITHEIMQPETRRSETQSPFISRAMAQEWALYPFAHVTSTHNALVNSP